ncbi:UNVERIFIED_CONTAM: hypothetical protein K2H54_022735, partial [Gekko kuhli]
DFWKHPQISTFHPQNETSTAYSPINREVDVISLLVNVGVLMPFMNFNAETFQAVLSLQRMRE